MISKKELKGLIYKISYEITEEIIFPMCKIPGDCVDIYEYTMNDYSKCDQLLNEGIRFHIADKYQLDEIDRSYLKPYLPIMQLAVIIILKGEVNG